MKTSNQLGFFLLVIAFFVISSDKAHAEEDGKITIKMKNTPVRTAIEKISQLSKKDILYADAILSDHMISCDLENVVIEEALLDILGDLPIAFKRTKKNQFVLYSQSTFKTLDVSGYIVDSRSGEALPYVNIHIPGSRIGTSSNQYGQFALHGIPAEEATLKAEYVGYKSTIRTLNRKNLSPHLKIEMEEYTLQTEAVVVEAFDGDVLDISEHAGGGGISLSPGYFSQLPQTWSRDMMRSLQLLPGVNQTGNGTSGLNIRGSSAAENLVTLDGMPLYHLDHAFGLLSVVNPDMIKDIRVHKSGFEAKYGGRTAGFVEMTGKSGSVSEVHMKTGLSELEFNGLLELPLSGKGSLLLAGRRSLLTESAITFYEKLKDTPPFREDYPQIQQFYNEGISPTNPRIMFYDTYAKLTLVPGTKDVITFSGYLSHDEITEEFSGGPGSVENRMDWGNTGYSMRWHRSWSGELYSDFMISTSRYEINDALPADSTYHYVSGYANTDIDNAVEELNIKMDNQWKLLWNHDLHAGIHFTRFETAFNEAIAEHDNVLTHGARGETISLYLQDRWQAHSRVSLAAGLRSTHYDRAGRFYWNPRLGAEFNIYRQWTLKASWGRYNQYILNFGNEFSNFDGRMTWMIADYNFVLKPASATHNVLGLKWENQQYLFDLEFYQKNMTGLVEQLNTIEAVNGVPNIQTSLVQRDGISKGVDLLLGKKRGRLSGWISYSYNQSERIFSNNSFDYPAGSDVPHSLNIVGNYRYRYFTFSAVWSHISGTAYTKPDTYTMETQRGDMYFLTAPVKRYSERLPDNQRLDFSIFYNYAAAVFDTRFGLSLYNVFNQNTIWYRHFSMKDGHLSAENIYMPGFTPTFVFELAFK